MPNRAGAAVAAMVLLAGCTGGDVARDGASTTDGNVVPPPSSTTPSPPAARVPTPTPVPDPPGSVSVRVAGLTLPDLRGGGTGLRLLVRAASPRLTVRRRGAGGAVSVCPVAGATTPVVPGECVDLAGNGAVDVAFVGGLELRAARADAAVEEVAVTFVPSDRSTTLVTPARPAGACGAKPCQATYSLTPGRAGPFTLDGRPSGGRPRLVLLAAPVGGGPNRTLATVEGGGLLSIRATLEPGEEAQLLHHQQGSDPVGPLAADISWP